MASGLWQLGQWRQVPVFVHWTLLLWLPWYWWRHESLLWAVMTFVAFVLLLLAHELGHAAAAKARRVPVNSIKLYVLHGQCEHAEPYREIDDVVIAWGGVLAQMAVLVLALAARFALRWLWPEGAYLAAPVFFVFITANLWMAAINLIPVAPLDGHKAWRALPLLRDQSVPRLRGVWRRLRRALDFKQRREVEQQSKRAAQELLERLRKK